MRLALVHDYLLQMGGAERVVATMAEAFPEASLFTSAADRGRLLPPLDQRDITTTFLDLTPGMRRHFKKYFIFYPAAFWSLGRVDAEVVWISSSGFSKWIRARPGAVTVCYCHTPPRFFWEPAEYLRHEVNNPFLRTLAKAGLEALRRADFARAQRIDHFIANSRCVQARIWEFYRRHSDVIHPPVDVDRFKVTPAADGSYYVVLSRLVGYKRVDRAVEAFNRLRQRLIVIGDGPDRKRLEALAGPTVEFAGRVNDGEARRLLQGARGLIFPGREDFGIAPVEAQACGKPVVAFGAGGALETVIDGETGVLFFEPTPDALADAVQRCDLIDWDFFRIRRNAERFARPVFLRQMSDFLARITRQPRRREAPAEAAV